MGQEPPASGTPRLPPLSYVWAAVLGGLALFFLLEFAYEVRAVLVMLLFSVLFALVLVYPIDLFARLMPRALAAVLTLLLVLAMWVLIVWVCAPFFANQVQWLIANIPAALARVQHWWQAITSAFPRFTSGLQRPLSSEFSGLLRQALPVAVGLVTAISSGFAVLALSLFLGYEGASTRRALMRLAPRQHELAFGTFLERTGTLLQRWMLGQLFSMTVTGVLTAIGMLILGVNSWLVLGMISFVLEFVPFIGPLMSAVPGIATGLAVSPSMALWVAVVYAIVQLIESNVLQPLIMKRAIRIQPALQLVWQLAMGAAFGLVGIFAATPLLACVQLAVEFFYIERKLGK